jgi:hypothetical protein
VYCLLKIEEGKKTLVTPRDFPQGYPTFKMITNFKDLNKSTFDECMLVNQNIEQMNDLADIIGANICIAHSCSKIAVLDIDDMNYTKHETMLTNYPYYLSSTKKLPHIFVINDSGKINTSIQYCFGELLYNWAFIPLNQNILNYNLPIRTIDYQFFECDLKVNNVDDKINLLDFKPMNIQADLNDDLKKTIEYKLCNIMSAERFDNRKDWIKIGMILKLQGEAGFQLWHYFSMSSKKYKKENFQQGGDDYNTWMSFRKNTLTIGTLHYMAKNDNPEMYKKLFKTDYKSIKEQFELNHCIIKSPLCFLQVHDNDRTFTAYSENKFKALTANIKFQSFVDKLDADNKPILGKRKFKTQSIFNTWLHDADRLEYKKIVFEPNPDYQDVEHFNLWTEFEAEFLGGFQNDDNKLNDILDYIKIRLCNNDDAFYEWFLNWLAQIFQRPWEKTRVVPIFKSVQGAGKNIFFDHLIAGMMGSKYYLSTADGDLLLGRFNSKLENKILVCYDEANTKTTFNNKDKFKALITNDTLLIEHKGVDAIQFKNLLNFVILTNDNCTVVVEPTDRRFTAIQMTCRKLDSIQADKYVSIFKSDKGRYLFYTFLLARNINIINLENSRVHTLFYEEMKEICESQVQTFVDFWRQNWTKDNIEIITQESDMYYNYRLQQFYHDYKEWRENYSKTSIERPYKGFCFDVKRIEGLSFKPVDTTKNGEKIKHTNVLIKTEL